MPKLKSRSSFPPNGFQFLQPETGFQPMKWSSFDSIVHQIIAHRKGNPHLAKKHGWRVDFASVENELDAYNAAICQANGNTAFLQPEAQVPSLLPPRWSFNRALSAAGEGVKRSAVGIKVVADWLGAGLKPVDKTLAEKRAAICVTCKENQNPNWIQKLDAAAAEQVKALLEVKNDLQLSTSNDAKLNSCQLCDCSLKLKVHVPMKHIFANTGPETMEALRAVKPPCWITTEKL